VVASTSFYGGELVVHGCMCMMNLGGSQSAGVVVHGADLW